MKHPTLTDLANATYEAMTFEPPFVNVAKRLMDCSAKQREQIVKKTPAKEMEEAILYLAAPEAIRERERRLRWLRADPRRISMVKVYYKDHIAQFIDDWGVTSDPRELAKGKSVLVPFRLWPKQFEMIDWMLKCFRTGTPGACCKGRDVGASWLMMALFCSLAVFETGFAAGVGSATELKLDRSGDPDTLFWKAKEFLKHLPEEFRAGYTEEKCAFYLRLTFPDTGASITGEAGSNIGRGGRKAQPTNTLIPTPNGWRTMGELQVGDFVFNANGLPDRIVAVHPQGIVPLYRVRFDDGTSTECCGDHLWHVITKSQRKNKARRRSMEGIYQGKKKPLFSVMTTCELLDLGITVPRPDGQVEYRYQIPQCDPVKYEEKQLPIHPYLLGVLLGDGGMTQNIIMLTSADIELVNRIKTLLPENTGLVKGSGKYSWRFTSSGGKGGGISQLRKSLTDLELYGKGSHDKFIPDIYLQGSIEQRVELLHGLIDTDGWISSRSGGSRVGYLSTSPQLLKDVTELVQSLGGIVSRSWKKGAMMTYPNGHKKWFNGCFELRITTPMNPAYLSRKADKWKPRQKYAIARSIVSVEPIESREAKCITVSNDDGLYLTNDYLVTHNSIYGVDEAAFIENPMKVAASLAANTNCRLDVSTPNGVNAFFDHFHNPAISQFLINWRNDPRKDQAWYDKKKSELDPVVFAQEIDASFYASAEGVLVPPQWVSSAVGLLEKLQLEPSGIKVAALDVADLGKDRCAWVARYGTRLEHAVSWTGTGSDIHATTAKAFILCDMYGITDLVYDSTGVGAGVRGAARVLNEVRVAEGRSRITVHEYVAGATPLFPDQMVPGTNRKAKDLFLNRSAQAAWYVRRRFEAAHAAAEGKVDEDAIISINPAIPEMSRLIAEFSQPCIKETPSGKWQVEKTPKGAKSPNLYDAVAMAFAPRKMPMVISPELLHSMAQPLVGMVTT